MPDYENSDRKSEDIAKEEEILSGFLLDEFFSWLSSIFFWLSVPRLKHVHCAM